ncbi:LOW QUALITY PROTEIN: solute carrier family 12 member 2-like [Gigantopelta aegis]|uniref:LOW QUALITY PROTEIN: solute carrier family 12 member 2-like n=1 Tax=Gigantopelta aegis TaxID=1735272 RepID=UPI001B888506|nr:LOW QUALITY PROTEIN: solute carrier family 12 member 2-like [Gigantopelta aegis]
MEGTGEELKKSNSRFKVARVDFVDEIGDTEQKKIEPLKLVEPDRSITDHVDRGPESPSATFSISGDTFSHSYDTSNNKTCAMMNTHEALPCLDHYRNIFSATGELKSRPTLAQLHEEMDDDDVRGHTKDPLMSREEMAAADAAIADPTDKAAQKSKGAPKFGWIKGVLIRCLLNIWGVMLFIRLSWVVGQAGLGLSILIILLSAVVTTLTALSMSAICTNGEVKGGGAYYMISRSLGPEYGGAIGLVFSVANAVAVAMYVVGFAETVRDLLKVHNALMVDETNDIRIVGVITITLLLAIAIIGMEWEARAQLILLVVLLIGLVNFVIGSFIPPTEEKRIKGFVGFRGDVFLENLSPSFRDGEEFFSVFSIFFPAATGILAGANISGDLKNASSSIPKGTLLGILISSLVYLLVAFLLGGCIVRDATGYIVPVTVAQVMMSQNVSTTTTTATAAVLTIAPNVTRLPVPESVFRNCSYAKDGVCLYGLMNDYQVMEMVSGFGPLITAGIFSATLSSALASLVSAPKVFQAVCKDKIFPYVHIFAKGYGLGDNPRPAYVLAFVIGLGFVLIGDLNAIAPVISNFFLMAYTLINYSCFDASLARSPGWRPAFRFYNMWISLIGALICLMVMFVINWWTALITLGIVSALFVYVHYTKPDVNWGSSTQAHVYRNALQATLKLISVEDHIKNFRPQVLVLSGHPDNRPALVDFVSHITKKISLMVCGHIIVGPPNENSRKIINTKSAYARLHKKKIRAFYAAITSPNFRLGAQNLMQTVGLGKMQPNTLIMGFKSDWRNVQPTEVVDYFNVIHDAFDMKYGVGILRLQEGFGLDLDMETTLLNDYNTEDELSDDDEITPDDTPPLPGSSELVLDKPGSSELVLDKPGSSELVLDKPEASAASIVSTEKHMVKVHIQNGPGKSKNKINIEVIKSMNKFARKQKRGTIDVWWLFDDGGLTLLIPYILTTKAHWRGCKLRVFTAATKKGELDREQRQMATLLSKFRIDYKDMVIVDLAKSPTEESQTDFQMLLKDWVLDEKNGETKEMYPWKTTQQELSLLKEKTNRQIRLGELLRKRSSEASLVVMSLPMPRKSTCSAGLYMAWLDTLTKNMPPILLLRGNQTSVLTYYS